MHSPFHHCLKTVRVFNLSILALPTTILFYDPDTNKKLLVNGWFYHR